MSETLTSHVARLVLTPGDSPGELRHFSPPICRGQKTRSQPLAHRNWASGIPGCLALNPV